MSIITPGVTRFQNFTTYCRNPTCVNRVQAFEDYCEACQVKTRRPSIEPLPRGVVWVYFIQQGTGPVKIGCTDAQRIETLLPSLQAGNPERLYQRVAFLADHFVVNVLHQEFESDRLSQDWFSPSLPVRRFIRNAKQGRFPNDLGGIYRKTLQK